MIFFGGLVIGLSLVFGCILLALGAELYYLLWWKRKIAKNAEIGRGNTHHLRDRLFNLVFWRRPSSLDCNRTQESEKRNPDVRGNEQDLELGSSKDFLLKGFGEEGVESELMRLHNLAGPPRFLFTIKEETKEDLESEDGKSRGDRSRKGSRTRSLSDLIVAADTPFLSPLASSPLKSPLRYPESYKHHGFNPLFESSTELELNKLRSSPPPKFKFLRDAEEKLLRKLIEEAERKAQKNCGSVKESGVKDTYDSKSVAEERDGSFFRLIVGKNKEKELNQNTPSSSQVLPLATSPTTLRTLDKATLVH